MKLIKLSLAAALAATMAVSVQAEDKIGVSANVSMTSNYMWRGMTQSANYPAIQGGFDLDYKGFYIGTWGSNVAGAGTTTEYANYGMASMELDVYGGYSIDVAGLTIDVGYLQFFYPKDSKAMGWGEAYVEVDKDFEVASVGVKASIAFDTNDNGWGHGGDTDYDLYELFVGVPLPMDMSLDGAYGYYTNVGQYYSASVTKSVESYDFTLAYTGIAYDEDYATDDEAKLVFTVGTSF